jgi:hypothetical protein
LHVDTNEETHVVRIATLGVEIISIPVLVTVHLAYLVARPIIAVADIIEDIKEAREYGHLSA